MLFDIHLLIAVTLVQCDNENNNKTQNDVNNNFMATFHTLET